MNNLLFNNIYFLGINLVSSYLDIKYIFEKYIYIKIFGYNDNDVYFFHDKVYQMYLKFKFFRKYFTIKELIQLKIFTIEDFNRSFDNYSYSSFLSFLVHINNKPINIFSKELIDTNNEITELLDIEGIDINSKTRYGKTILMIALENQNFNLVKKILDKNPDLNLKEDDEHIMSDALKIYLTYKDEDKKISEILINKNSSNQIYKTNCSEDFTKITESPLYIAALHPNCSLEKFKLLIENGANINFKDESKCSILYIQLRSLNLIKDEEYELCLQKIKELIKYGAIIDKNCLYLINKFPLKKKKLLNEIMDLEYFFI